MNNQETEMVWFLNLIFYLHSQPLTCLEKIRIFRNGFCKYDASKCKIYKVLLANRSVILSLGL